jgi:hypothetical protein
MAEKWMRRRNNVIKLRTTDAELAEIDAAWPQSGAPSRQDWLLRLTLKSAGRLRPKA